jgi:hypothetical protein
VTDTPLNTWPRPYVQQAGGKSMLLFFIFGSFAEEIVIPARKYDSAGLPPGVELQRYQNAVLSRWEGYPLSGVLGEILKEDNPAGFERARQAPHVLAVRGEVDDSASLDYLRDTLGVVAALLDAGGSVVVDPQLLSLYEATQWRNHYLVEGGAPPRNHVLILCSDDEHNPGRQWVHTRGMRKFARPDISLRNVPADDTGRAGILAERMVEMQALGAHFVDGQGMDIDGVGEDVTVYVGGSHDDPAFNNTHAELIWPDVPGAA